MLTRLINRIRCNCRQDERERFNAKPWGRFVCVYHDDSIEIVRIEVAAGWYSSVHLHEWKTNEFSVAIGQLTVTQDDPCGWTKNERLRPGSQPVIVPVRTRHLFFAETDIVAWEIYRAVPDGQIDRDDIVRFSSNGYGGSQGPDLSGFSKIEPIRA